MITATVNDNKSSVIKNYTIKSIWSNNDYIVTLDILLQDGTLIKNAKLEITKEWLNANNGAMENAVRAALGD
ncbi:hypothetical protein [Bacillus sp. V5-8f]|uniref:hypothetical protein n=1 Tax=Bacillus sp. V5-8f TaxID=2053044 RepID=UPI000C76560B|nr:hypothetical protein [Bacillus sp. V5-8f]PLT35660.1 hypothetical protein CUU64_03405 [Bacillus sp. V5-8f]